MMVMVMAFNIPSDFDFLRKESYYFSQLWVQRFGVLILLKVTFVAVFTRVVYYLLLRQSLTDWMLSLAPAKGLGIRDGGRLYYY